MRPILFALLVLALLAGASACDEAAEPEPTEPDEVEVDSVAALTGELVDAAVAERPIVAIKVDNAPGARPPVGLEDADLVIEEPVEGGVTRFLALYQTVDEGTVGPVRSAREVDAELVPPFDPLFAISGAATPVIQLFADLGLATVEEGESGAFRREGDRRSPHNLFADLDALFGAAMQEPIEPVWPFSSDLPDGGDDVEGVSMQLTHAARAAWSWDGDRWLRSQDGDEHRTADDEQLSAANVVIARVPVTGGTRRDAAGVPTVEVDVVGEGDALVLRDGQAFEARWRKRSAQGQFEWLDAEGERLPLTPGVTWVELVPEAGSVDVTSVDEGGDGGDGAR